MSRTKDFDEKRNEILDYAEKLFILRGYELTTVNAILKEVGIGKGTFYYYFESKEEAMDAVIMRIIDDELVYAKEIISRKDLAPIEKLIISLFSKPKSEGKKVMIEQLYKANNALMKQRAMQRTLELVCPIYAEMIIEGNNSKDFFSINPLADIQFLVAGIQTLYDLSGLSEAKIEVNLDAILNTLFRVIQIDENRISKVDVRQMMIKNM
ncbi:TetR/AcrR family transcriptional regulator [Candidatus Enterococcus mansonii]|uniref:HTH tetR-type domain-containing protein n=1 Tax=Candidatus Enterococcus mansonii TaxID=1834181 RepID=A0A242CF39_9ENTE|nr:TetR/AcrR family transcriptional regulator [Enterococcus sp. 4G2_DIV0659]OTO08779.1 hypothetical protein A5880_001779 [Enterococcus sp. 4G2_DIV0659]